MKKIFVCVISLILFFIAGFVSGKIQTKNSMPLRIAFLGDSITDLGWSEDFGYVKQTVKELQEKGIKVIPVPAGIWGHRTQDMLERIDNDVIKYYPDIMVFMGGINDVIHQRERFDDFKSNIKQIIDKAKANNIKIIMLNLTVMTNDIYSEDNKEIDKYNEFLSEFAKKENIKLIDVNSAFKEEIKRVEDANDYILTTDGLHLNEKGNKIITDLLVKEIIRNR